MSDALLPRRGLAIVAILLLSVAVVMGQDSAASAQSSTSQPAATNDVVIKNGTILTVTHGKIENGSVYIHNGKIAESLHIGRDILECLSFRTELRV